MSIKCLERGHTLSDWGKTEIPCTKEKLKNSEKFNKQAQICHELYEDKALLYAQKVKDCRGEVDKTIKAWQGFIQKKYYYKRDLCSKFVEGNAICEAYTQKYNQNKESWKTKALEIEQATGPRRAEYEALVQARCIVNLLKQTASTATFTSEVSGCTSDPIDTSVMEIRTPGLVPMLNCYDVHLKDKFEPLTQTLINMQSVEDPIEDVNTELQHSLATSMASFKANPQDFLCS
jgi:hypothetical protein